MSEEYVTRANDFDARVGILQMEKALELSVGDSLLEIGCGEGRYTQMFFKKFHRIVGIDLDEKNIERANWKSVNHPYCDFFVADAQNFVLEETFNTILIANILEHVDNPIAVLGCAKKYLEKDGRIIIIVPNAWSFNRLIAKEMGIIDDVHALPTEQAEKYGHKIVYDPCSLASDIGNAGLEIIESGGIVFKPFTNKQMQKILDDLEKEELKNKLVEALNNIGQHRFPSECTSIYAVAK